MLLSYEYSREYLPSAPVIEIGLRRTPKEREIAVEALLDTGADATILPYSLLKRINGILSKNRGKFPKFVLSRKMPWIQTSEIFCPKILR
jgi:hypothetical protein